MNRQNKIEFLLTLAEGKKKLLDIINHGMWLWNLRDGVYHCENIGFEGLKISQVKWETFRKGGGSHFVQEKAYPELVQVYSDKKPSWSKDNPSVWAASWFPHLKSSKHQMAKNAPKPQDPSLNEEMFQSEETPDKGLKIGLAE